MSEITSQPTLNLRWGRRTVNDGASEEPILQQEWICRRDEPHLKLWREWRDVPGYPLR